MVDKQYKEMLEKLEKETDSHMSQNKNPDEYLEDLKSVLKQRVKQIHMLLDTEKDKFVNKTIDEYKENMKKHKEKYNNNNSNITNDESKPFKEKIGTLMNSLEDVMQNSECIEKAIDVFKKDNYNEIYEIKGDDFLLKVNNNEESVTKA